MIITKENLIATRYIDNEQTLIEIKFNDYQREQHTIAINADPENETFQSLLQVKSLAQLQESSDNVMRQEIVQNRIMDAWYNVHKFTPEQLDFIANADETTLERLQHSTDDSITHAFRELEVNWESILKNDIAEDQLFRLKLTLFEDPDIERSKKTAQKTKLRKATNVIETFYYYGLIKGVGK